MSERRKTLFAFGVEFFKVRMTVLMPISVSCGIANPRRH
ncbi:hypothetical protein Asd1617_04351 [Shigella dysenteriae 1617]|uniref:Uncharacterized protein n=1 Tax=Shigella dysenteriae 1617 TaxID=754093 RepID=A0A0A6ZXZ2_SHIDY|nr:hypothetical protein Asd1617_00470 [Shigella dysenteriae 1617]AHA66516.1 hypothetical protein Asd1617_03689 [Shigella dysenteriae 1617]AHA67178.1 hypothetical protein Asd1617_04351 [Shigella dysenteriae 1617]